MNRLSTILLTGVLYLCSCSSGETPSTLDTTKIDTASKVDSVVVVTPPASPKLTMTVYDEDDNQLTLPIDDSTCYCLMASWCPHSKRILSIVNDPDYDPLTKKHTLVFLYDKNEIDDLQGAIEKDPNHQGMRESELPALYRLMRERKDEGKLIMPQVLSDIPEGVKYYYVDYKSLEFASGGYPSAFHRRTQQFDINPINWWFAYDQQDSVLAKSMVSEYKKDE